MLKRTLLILIATLFIGCQTSHKPLVDYFVKNHELTFQIDSNSEYKLTIRSLKYQPRYSNNVIHAYTLFDDINAITIEHIHLNSNASWSGQALSLYENFMKTKLKIKELKKINVEHFGNYEFITYMVDGKTILYFVYVWEVNKNTFIYDAKGLLYNKLIKKFKPDYTRTEQVPNYGRSFLQSLVFENNIRQYFR